MNPSAAATATSAPEHILLAIARGDEESMAVRLLRAEGVVPDELRVALLAALAPQAATG